MEKCWTIESDFKYYEFENALKAIESKNWMFILILNIDPTKSLLVNDFRFVSREDKNQNHKIVYNDWSVSIETLRQNQDMDSFRATYKFIAPDGKIRYLDMEFGPYFKGINNVIRSMRKLVELGKFNNWEQYDLAVENLSLKTKNDNLSKQIEKLRNEIDELKNIIPNK